MFSFFGGGPPPTHFEQQLRAYSVLFLPGANRESVDQGGKIILPPSALERLAHLNIQYPMLFKLGNERADRTTHAGVLEFVAEEGRAYLPHWMMQNLLLNEGDIINITNASLRSANYSKFQPQTANFLDISNPKAVLENTLRGFACLTEGDIIAIPYNNKVYEIAVLEVKPKDPSHAVSIIECDMQLEFEKPLDYVEPDYKAMAAEEKARKAAEEAARAQEEVKAEVEKAIEASTAETKAFSGTAFRLDGKPVTSSDESAASAAAAASASTSTSSTASGDSAAAARRKSQNVLAEAAAARRARAAAQAAVAEQRYTPGKLSFSSAPARPASASTADAKKTASSSSAASSASSSSSNAPPASSGFEAFKGTAHKLR